MTPRHGLFVLQATLVALSVLALGSAHPTPAETTRPLTIDARTQPQPPQTGWLQMGTATNPAGQTLTVNSRYLELNGQPWLPVMGEFHYSRVPRQDWDTELLKMKAAGVQIVSFYVIWIHHEEVEGQFDWTGDRDLREFTRLCQKDGLLALVRLGPWAHAEVRNGGLPDWVLQRRHTRSNDEAYLAAVDTFYKQIATQLHGLLWKDGGPVLGVQLENEYMLDGPGQGPAHIAKLKKMALADGLDVPLYTVTGWDGAVFPAREVLPVFGGYPDWPWDSSLDKLPPNEVYSFRFNSREGGDMGAPGGRPASKASQAALAPYPFLSAEFGGGTQDTYHRRPVLRADDIAAMLPTQLGSGVNMFGYYMFQGGANPRGKLTTLQESQATGAPNDMQQINYDFQAPLGEYGEERESYRKLKLFDYFLNAFGPRLAPMTVHAPDAVPSAPADFSVPRVSVRSLGGSGFLFLNNYVRGYTLPARPNFQVRVRLPDGDIMVPQNPMTLPSGSYAIWPVGLTVEGVNLRYATAQLLTTLHTTSATYVFAVAQDGIAPEFAISFWPGQTLQCASACAIRDLVATLHPQPGTSVAFTVESPHALPVHFVVLSQQQAERLTVLQLHGKKALVYTGDEVFADGLAIHLRTVTNPRFTFGILAAEDFAWQPSSTLTSQPAEGIFKVWQAILPEKHVEVTTRELRPAGLAPPIHRANPAGWRTQPVAVVPDDAVIENTSATWSLTVPPTALEGVANVFLKIDYQGDLARLYHGTTLLDDDFANGLPWVIGLKRFARDLATPLELRVMPLRSDAPVYFDAGYKPVFTGKQVARLLHVTAIPEYEFILRPEVSAETR